MYHKTSFYVDAVPNVHSELAIPLIVKNRVIGVIDIEAREIGYFTEEHKPAADADRVAHGGGDRECATLHAHYAPGAHAAAAE